MEKYSQCAEFDYDQRVEYAIANNKKLRKDVKLFARERIANLSSKQVSASKSSDGGTQATTIHSCHLCPSQFCTLQKYSLHMFKAHGIKNVWRTYIADCPETIHCVVCLKQYWTRERLLNHVRYRSKGV